MKRTLIAILVVGAVGGLGGRALGSDFSSSARGTTTAAFLELGVGARAVSMGEAYTAATNDVDSLYWNPAGLANVKGRSATFMHAPYLDSSSFDYLGYAQKVSDHGAVGVGIQYFTAGSIAGTDASGVDTGSFTPNDMAVTVGYAQKMSCPLKCPIDGGTVGVNVKYIQSKIATSASAEAIDLGVQSRGYQDDKLKFGLAVANLGTTMKFDKAKENLPLALKLGSSYKIQEHWLAALDLDFPRDNTMILGLGTEYQYPVNDKMQLAGRLGYNSRSQVSGFTGPSFGLGFGFDKYSLDYALVPFGDLGTAHRLSLSARF